MKKVLFIISAVALTLVSCTKFEDEPVVTFETASAPIVEVSVTSDNSISFVVTPGKNTGYYAYAVLKGEVDPATVDAATLIAGKTAGALKTQVGNSADKKTQVLTGSVDNLTSNTKYTVVAVASSTGTQSLSKVSALTVTTTDETAPAVVLSSSKAAVDGKTIVYTVAFDDPVELTDTAAFVVRVYAKHVEGPDPYLLLPIKQLVVPADNVAQASASTVTVKVPEEAYAPGAYTALFIAQGSVVNALGSYNAAFVDNYIILHGTYKAATSGLLAQYANVSFELKNPIAEETVYSAKDLTTLALDLEADGLFGDGNTLYEGDEDITVTTVDEKTGRKIEYTLQNWNIDATSQTSVVVGVDEAVNAGSLVSYSIPAGVVEDVYGNKNKALDIEDQVYCSFYGVEDIVGTWTYNGTSAYGPAYNETDKWVFAASDDATKGNVMLTSIFGWPNDYNVYCNFDLKELTLTIPDAVPFYDYVEYKLNEDKTDYEYDGDGNPIVADAGVLITKCYNADEVTFKFAEGSLSGNSCIFGYYGVSSVDDENSGFWNAFSALTLTKDSATPSPVPAKKVVRKLDKGIKVIK